MLPGFFSLYLIWVTLLISGCEKTPTVEAIRTHIDAMVDGIERKKPDDVLAYMHDDFSTPDGQDKQWAKRLMLFHMMRQHSINIVTSQLNITEQDEFSADAQFHVLLTGGEGLIPQQGALYQVNSQWRLQNGNWLLIHASWSKL